MKFNNVSIDSDTVITSQIECKFGEYDVLYQQWVWDGINAESLIFCNTDIVDISINKLVAEVANSPLLKEDKRTTHSTNEEYTYINFNFTVGD